jgi:hypothetical protein
MSTPKRHRHVFTALWSHFGPFSERRQTHHIHGCFTEGCDLLLVGEGYNCKLKAAHRRERL